jgi:hypothetical protein
MRVQNTFLGLLCCFLLATTISYAQISGKVFRDYDADGNQDLTRLKENGLTGIKVKAYDIFNFSIASTITDLEGNFQLAVPQGQQVRIEYSNIPDRFFPTKEGLTRFITSPAQTINLGLNKSGTYADKKPFVLTAIYGYGNPLLENYPATNALVAIPYFSDKTEKAETINLAKHSEVGSVWGIAADGENQKVYSAAFLKRHAGFGKAGISGIYVSDFQSKETTTLLKLLDLGIEVGTDLHEDLTANLESQSVDGKVFEQIGKVGLGGIDVSDDGKHLFVVNLFDQSLYKISLVNHKDFKKYILPVIDNKVGNSRPFAVKYYQGNVFVGVINDASVSQKKEDLIAKVFRIDADGGDFKEVSSIPLNYARGKVTYSLSVSDWNPWTDDFSKLISAENTSTCIHPQPILSDIDFDEDGTMVLGFMDRTGHQIGVNQPDLNNIASYSGTASGDILRCYPKKKSQFVSENNAKVGDFSTEGSNNKQGPDGGEFYFQEQFSGEGMTLHEETGLGGIALLAGTGQVLNSVHEPTDEYDTGGIKWFDNHNGKSVKGVTVFGSNQMGTFKKLNGVGDVEVVNGVQPIVVGSRLWTDCNENGKQDVYEDVLSEKEVFLYQKDQLITKLATDKFGKVTFEKGLKPITEYELRVSLKNETNISNENLSLTQANNASDDIDNDAEIVGEFAVIKFKTENYGENIFSLDFGFKCIQKPVFKTSIFCSNEGGSKVARVMVSSFDNANRLVLQKGNSFSGSLNYKTAAEIPQGGLILNEWLSPKHQQEYSLRIYQADGCFSDTQFSVSEEGCSTSEEENLSLNLFPNPASDKVKISYRSDTSENISVLIYDVLGRVITQKDIQGNGTFQASFDISKFTNGAYILGIKDGPKRLSRAFVKEQ